MDQNSWSQLTGTRMHDSGRANVLNIPSVSARSRCTVSPSKCSLPGPAAHFIRWPVRRHHRRVQAVCLTPPCSSPTRTTWSGRAG